MSWAEENGIDIGDADYFEDMQRQADIIEKKQAAEWVSRLPKWKTKMNEIIDIKDMTNSHLRNTINLIKRSKTGDNDYLFYPVINMMESELEKRQRQGNG